MEYRVYRNKRNSIPVRIHVNGSRGKSSVTRLIAAGLRAGGFRVYAKITGTLPRLILPDGTEKNIRRFGFPNILEQKEMISEAASGKADVAVLECMALVPFNQWISEKRIINATHAVVTNVREDHLEIMGPGKKEVALSFCATIPQNGQMFTCEKEFLPLFHEVCKEQNTKLVSIRKEAEIQKHMQGFAYYEYPENVTLALEVCGALGVPVDTALEGMWSAIPDPGASYSSSFFLKGKKVHFTNAFAANDPQSARQAWERANDSFPNSSLKIALVNCRQDRQERSEQMGLEIASWKTIAPDLILCMGERTKTFQRSYLKNGKGSVRILDAESKGKREILELLQIEVLPDSHIVGLGNIAGLGLELLQSFREMKNGKTETWTF